MRILKIALAGVVVLLVGTFIWNTDFDLVIQMLQRTPYAFLAVLGLSFLAYTMGALSWWFTLEVPYQRGVLSKLWSIRHVGEMLALFNPTNVIAGDGLKYLYGVKLGIQPGEVSTSVLMSRAVLIASALPLMITGLLYMMYSGNVLHLDTTSVAIVFFAFILAVGLIGYGRRYLHALFIHKWGHLKVIQKLTQQLTLLHSKVTGDKKMACFAALFACLHWIFGACEFWAICVSLGHDINLIDAICFEMGVLLLKTIAFMIPGQIGVEEYANKVMLAQIGIPGNEIWFIVSILRRCRQLFWLLVAIPLYYYIHLRMRPLGLAEA